MENLLGKALTALKKTTAPGTVLNELYGQLFNCRYSKSTHKQFHKLARNYGRYRVYFALAKMADSYYGREEMLNTDNPYPLITTIIRNDLEEQLAIEIAKEENSLQDYADDYIRSLRTREKVHLPDTFEEINGE
jgi:hypothetical protein